MLPEPRWLLDTCVVSELAREQPHPAVLAWLRANAAAARLCVVTLGELSYGVERLVPSARRNRLQAWLSEVDRLYAQRLLPTDREAWLLFGRLKAALQALGRPRDDLDLLIAATAIVNGLAVVTRNTSHFEDTGVRLVNPWLHPAP